MQGTQAPAIRNGAATDGSIVISHKEYIRDIRSGPNFNGKEFHAQSFRLNPGDANTFPWLAQISSNFQQYRFEGLCFHFKSMSGDALTSTNTALGSVIMSTIYDAVQESPTSKQEMENTEYAQSIKPSQTATHFIECAKSKSTLTELYVNQNPTKQKGDPRFYDFGKFTIATEGMQAANTVLGELWVSYQIRLFKPQTWDALGRDVGVFHYGTNNVIDQIDDNHPLGKLDWTLPDLHPSHFGPYNNISVTAKTKNLVRFEAQNAPRTFSIQLIYGGSNVANLQLINDISLINCGPCNDSILSNNSSNVNSLSFPASGQTANFINVQMTVNVDGENLGKQWGINITSDTPNLPNPITTFVMNVQELPYRKNIQ